VLSSELAFSLLCFLAILFGVLGLVGRVLDEAIDEANNCGEEDVE
jgi:hypothetical protein